MSDEIEEVYGVRGRYKRVKPSSILKPCEHHISEYGRIKKQVIAFHGAADGTTRAKRIKV